MHTETMPAPSGVTLTRKGERYCHEHATAEIPQFNRAAIETEVERLIGLLDDLDADLDHERDDDDEPTLGWSSDPGRYPGRQQWQCFGCGFDDGEVEPTLGWTNHVRQGGADWHGDLREGELEDGKVDDEEGGDAEPDESGIGDLGGLTEQLCGEGGLGWLTWVNQDHRGWHGESPEVGHDAEAEPDRGRPIDFKGEGHVIAERLLSGIDRYGRPGRRVGPGLITVGAVTIVGPDGAAYRLDREGFEPTNRRAVGFY